MQRVCVIGPCGAGKSVFSLRLGERLGLPVVHMDRLNWRPGWVEVGREELVRQLGEVMARPRWIIDGNYSGTMAMRLARADAVIFLDLPPRVYRWAVVKRVLKAWGGYTRPDMTEGCPERLNWEFLSYVWRFHREARPRILQRLSEMPDGVELVKLRSRREVRAYLDALPTTDRA